MNCIELKGSGGRLNSGSEIKVINRFPFKIFFLCNNKLTPTLICKQTTPAAFGYAFTFAPLRTFWLNIELLFGSK